ncbi:puratrophin-1-like [Clinocottus analis]|uniref:puratrophin-1-like n=1 Tax=Clinocottus analis TaxID=304258 RepID=UPI0035C24D5B
MDHERRTSKSCSRPLVKPVGWVSPNTWDSRNYREIEGDYVDLVDIATGKEFVSKQRGSHAQPHNPLLFKPVRPPPPVPPGGQTQSPEEPRPPGGHSRPEPTEQDPKGRYRDSYVAALRNPVAFERSGVDLLAALDEGGPSEEGESRVKVASEAQRDKLVNFCKHCNKPVTRNQLCQSRRCCERSASQDLPSASDPEHLMKESPMILRSTPGLSQSHKVQMRLISHQSAPSADVHAGPDGDVTPAQEVEAVKPPGKHKVKARSLSTVSETCKGSPLLYKVNTRSHSDICPETISSMMQGRRADLLDQVTLKLERLKSPRKDSHSHRGEPSSAADGPDSKLHHSKTEKSSHAQVQLPAAGSDSAQQLEGFRGVRGMLDLGIVCLPGSRDRTGRAVLEVHGGRKEWTSSLVSVQSVCELLLYLHSIPRKEVGELGMTLVMDARRKPPPLLLYKALLMAQEQALHAVHSLVMLVDKDTCPRPEKHPGLQMDLVTSMKALNKTVEASQLTSDLGGTFTYSHTDWLQFHQRLVCFLSELRGADSLLQKAIRKVDGSKMTDSAQEVQQCIEEQKASMKEVLEDAHLVTLQREGGAVLARMRREEFRFPLSEDYRDALESVTSVYNQVEEKLHTLVMRSNESLQNLDFLFRLREMEATISTAGTWFNAEGEQTLKDSYATEDHWLCTEEALQHFEEFLSRSKDKHQRAMSLVTEAKAAVGSSDPSPATEVFRTLVSTFKSNTDDFMLRAERRHKELHTAVHLQRFCEQASALAKECSDFLEQVEQGCYPPQTLRTLQMFEERLGAEFSPLHFQAVRAEAGSVGSGASGAMRVWNAAWIQRTDVGQRLKAALKKEKGVDKNQIRQLTAANHQGGVGGMEGEERKTRRRPREHRSEADLRSAGSAEGSAGFPSQRPLGRSLSEGSSGCSGVTSISGFSPLNVRHKLCRTEAQTLEQKLQPVQSPLVSHKESLRSGNLSCESTRDEGGGCPVLTPETLLTAADDEGSSVVKLCMIMEELLCTEREYVKALGYVRQHYFPELERPDVPQDLRGQRGSVFGNLEKLHDFHRHHFLHELESCVSEPFRAGRCFLRHRESFALYALYSKNKPQSDRLLIDHGQTFFKQKQLQLGDKMDLWSYLLKPVQRISKYSLLLQDMRRECGPERTRETAEVEAALEVIHFQLHHGNNLLAMDAIHHCDVNLKEQGQLIRQDEFLVTFRKKKCLRHIFLFQELILFSKTRKTDVGNETYLYKQSFKTSDVGMTQNSGDSGLCFEIWFRKRKTQDTYTLQAAGREVKDCWTRDLERILWEQAVHNREVRMQESVFMGIGNKPFMDIQPSDAAIHDRAVSCVMMGRENRPLSSMASSDPQDKRLLGGRPKSVGSGCSSSSSSSSVVGYTCGPKRPAVGAFGGYASPPGALEEDDLDHESGSHSLLLDSSESSGESVSGFSSCSRGQQSAAGGEAEDASTSTEKEAAAAPTPPAEKTPPAVAPKPKTKPPEQPEDPLCGNKVQHDAFIKCGFRESFRTRVLESPLRFDLDAPADLEALEMSQFKQSSYVPAVTYYHSVNICRL